MSLHTDRITHKSSACSPTFEKISLISVPHWLYFLNSKGDPNAAPVRRSVLSVIGIGLPENLVSDGFGSNVSTCDGPPFMKRCSTRFAFAGSGGLFGASGLTAP